MERTRTAFVAALLMTLMVTGCSSGGPSNDDKRYADAVAAADPDDYGGLGTNDLASALGDEGKELCHQLDASYADAFAYAKLGYSERQTTALIAAAVLVYCPDNRDKIPTG
ncbi:DUF732 domain-containing protein [Streptomyces sp. NPDC052207]|uniref:DUF732 domain-containing protein n=1 Tax=Streptomyces sp. NPDC052207 TaxID=3155418 RepID=UPI003446F8FA